MNRNDPIYLIISELFILLIRSIYIEETIKWLLVLKPAVIAISIEKNYQ